MSPGCFHSAGPRGLIKKRTNVPCRTEGNMSLETLWESFFSCSYPWLSFKRNLVIYFPARTRRVRATAWLRQGCCHHPCHPLCFPDTPAYSEPQHNKPLAHTVLQMSADVPQRCNLDPTFQHAPMSLPSQPRTSPATGRSLESSPHRIPDW